MAHVTNATGGHGMERTNPSPSHKV